MSLDWSSLGEVALVSIGVTVGVVIVFSLGVRALGSGEEESGAGGATTRRAATPATAVAGLCFLACAAVVAYGLYLIIPQLH
ncbi:membrane protein [Streptomyces sp. AcH 505]|uniref:hypothetical protein n=1 Tax=Streptomyces sp. AcH 505 TaxID=352211 RepID=UPI000591B60D|nr:membrane protein [Streptomyces sp. AcH 505]